MNTVYMMVLESILSKLESTCENNKQDFIDLPKTSTLKKDLDEVIEAINNALKDN